MDKIEMTPEQRRRNALAALALAAFALFILATSVPFWRGLYKIALSSGG
jgi:hypothetical protein